MSSISRFTCIAAVYSSALGLTRLRRSRRTQVMQLLCDARTRRVHQPGECSRAIRSLPQRQPVMHPHQPHVERFALAHRRKRSRQHGIDGLLSARRHRVHRLHAGVAQHRARRPHNHAAAQLRHQRIRHAQQLDLPRRRRTWRTRDRQRKHRQRAQGNSRLQQHPRHRAQQPQQHGVQRKDRPRSRTAGKPHRGRERLCDRLRGSRLLPRGRNLRRCHRSSSSTSLRPLRGNRLHRDLRHKAVAPPRHRLHKATLLRILVQRAAQRGDRHAQVGLLHEGALPHARQQIFLRQQLARMPHQLQQQIEHPPRQRDLAPRRGQQPVGRVQPEALEDVHLRLAMAAGARVFRHRRRDEAGVRGSRRRRHNNGSI